MSLKPFILSASHLVSLLLMAQEREVLSLVQFGHAVPSLLIEFEETGNQQTVGAVGLKSVVRVEQVFFYVLK